MSRRSPPPWREVKTLATIPRGERSRLVVIAVVDLQLEGWCGRGVLLRTERQATNGNWYPGRALLVDGDADGLRELARAFRVLAKRAAEAGD